MSSYNKIILVGNLTRDIDLKTFEGGGSVANFGLAVNERYKDREGNDQERVCFIDVEMWGRQAEVANDFLYKGRKILIEGSLKQDTWEQDDGQRRSKHSIRATNFRFMGSREDEEGGGAGAGEGAAPSSGEGSGGETKSSGRSSQSNANYGGSGGGNKPQSSDESEDDIPF